MLIGLENFSNPEGAIVELVKNAYDADSPYCYILFDVLTNGEKCIYIVDAGCGMTEQIIRDCWMRIGTDDKLLNAYSQRGRVKSGAKGIGRFALNRLGAKSQMFTMRRGEAPLHWSVEWGAFNRQGITVNDVTAELNEVPIEAIQLELNYLNERFDEGEVIVQYRCPVLPQDTAEDVAKKVHALEYEYYPQVIERLLSEMC